MRAFRTVLVAALVASETLHVGFARAQPVDALAEGRKVFAEALDDEEHGRLTSALAKYRQVQTIRDTIPIRFRIAATLESLGRLREAAEAYGATTRLTPTGKADEDVVSAARTHADTATAKIGHLQLVVQGRDAREVEVTVDGDLVATDGLADVRVDPGRHVVAASAPGSRPFRNELVVGEGQRPIVTIAVGPSTPPAPEEGLRHVSESPPSSMRTVGYVVGGIGAALAIGGGVVLGLRSSAISDLEEACPAGACPRAREGELNDTRDRAVTFGPLGVGLLVAGGVALATGIVLILSGKSSKTGSRASTRSFASLVSLGASDGEPRSLEHGRDAFRAGWAR